MLTFIDTCNCVQMSEIFSSNQPSERVVMYWCRAQRKRVAAELQKLLRILRKKGMLQGKAEVISAKVPIIKCHIDVGQGVSIPTDISLGAANGAEAVPFILRQVRACILLHRWHCASLSRGTACLSLGPLYSSRLANGREPPHVIERRWISLVHRCAAWCWC